jgi:glycosyltransferase involved in cell wall biosynthesis
VLHVIDSFEIGGTERQAVELLKRLNRKRYDVRLAVLRKGGLLYREIEPLFPAISEFPLTSFYNANAVKQLGRLCRLMLHERIDILHAHDFYSGFIGAAAARLVGVRVIASQRHLKLSDREVHRWGTRVIHRLAHRILVNSEAIREKIIAEDNANPDKIAVVKNGVVSIKTAATSRSGLRRELKLEDDAKLIGIVARLQQVKGHRFFIEAAAGALRGGADAHFVLVGNGPLRGEIEKQIADVGITARVHLLGDRSDVASLIPALDLLALTSLHEGLPNAVMEAMAAGVPVVATAVGGVKELISDGETGYLAPPADSAALAARILFALEDEANRARITAAARRHIEASFGMQRMLESVEKLYDEQMEAMNGRRFVATPLRFQPRRAASGGHGAPPVTRK